MTNRMKFLRSTTTGNTPPSGTADDVGRLAFNLPDRKLWMYQADGTPRLIARDIRGHDSGRAYAQGDMVIEGNVLYRAPASIAAGSFDAAQWNIVSDFRGDAILREPETAGAATITFQDDLTLRVEASSGQSEALTEWVGPDGTARAAIGPRGVPAAGMGAGRFAVTQTAHSFTAVGQAARYDGSAWVLARADSVNTYGIALVAEIIDANNVVLATSGEIEGLEAGAFSGGSISSNTRYYVSTSNAGELTAVEPAEPDEQNPVLYVADAPNGHVQIWRPGGGGAGGGAGVTVTQDPNPFTAIGQAVCFTSGQFALARADDDNRAAIGIITATSGLTFSFATAGKVENIDPSAVDGPQLVPGAVYYVSGSTAGQLTETRPDVDSASLAPLIEAVSADSAVILSPTKDTSVVRDFGNQTIAGTKTFSDGVEAASYGGDGVTQSSTDTTAGRLLKVGDFGVGETNNLPDGLGLRDHQHPVGWFRAQADTPNRDDAPYGDNFYTYRVENLGSGTRRFTIFRSGDPSYSREVTSSGQTPWLKKYDSGNIVGTVSQSGGDPTGAVFEEDSNDDGHYIRYASGVQICWRSVSKDLTTTNQSEYSAPADYNTSYPVAASFSIAGVETGDSLRDALGSLYVMFRDGEQTWRLRNNTTASSENDFPITLSAIGRWF